MFLFHFFILLSDYVLSKTVKLGRMISQADVCLFYFIFLLLFGYVLLLDFWTPQGVPSEQGRQGGGQEHLSRNPQRGVLRPARH